MSWVVSLWAGVALASMGMVCLLPTGFLQWGGRAERVKSLTVCAVCRVCFSVWGCRMQGSPGFGGALCGSVCAVGAVGWCVPRG